MLRFAKQRLLHTFSLDARGLGIFRILLGLLVLADLFMNASSLSWLFGAHSVLPPDVVMSNFFEQNYRGIHVLSGAIRWQYILFAVQWIFAVCLLIWWHTRAATVGTWILLSSLQGANPLIINSWDILLRLLLFRGIFLPLGERYSLDATHKTSKDKHLNISSHAPYQVFGVATLGIILQVFFVYVFSYFLKTDPIWTQEFSATYYALSIDMFATSRWQLLYQHPVAMKWLTAFVIYLEGFWPLLYLIPRRQQFFKTLVCLMFMWFHLGLFITMHIWLFPLIGIVAWIPLLPSWVWDRTDRFVSHILSLLAGSTGPSARPHQNALHTNALHAGVSSSVWNNAPHVLRTGRWWTLWLIAIILYITFRNIRWLDFEKYQTYFPATANKFWFLLRIDQYRSMFAPYPMRDDGWYVIAGKKVDGSLVNMLLPDRPVSYTQKPSHEDLVRMFPHEKWRKLLNNLWFKKNASYRWYYLAYLCWDRNRRNTDLDRVSSIVMSYIVEMSEPDYKTDPLQRVDLFDEYVCGR